MIKSSLIAILLIGICFAQAETNEHNQYEQAQPDFSDQAQPFYWIKKLAQKGDPEAQYTLSQIYMEQEKSEEAQIMYLLEESAKQGHAKAQFFLSGIYQFKYEKTRNPDYLIKSYSLLDLAYSNMENLTPIVENYWTRKLSGIENNPPLLYQMLSFEGLVFSDDIKKQLDNQFDELSKIMTPEQVTDALRLSQQRAEKIAIKQLAFNK